MDAATRETLEREIRAKCDAGDFHGATSLAVERYGPELLGFLIKIARSENDGNDAYSQFQEDLWSGLPDFRWTASFRTWAYVLARNAFYRQRSSPQNDPDRNVPLSRAPEIARMSNGVRSETLAHLRTENKNALGRFLEQLNEEDREIALLRHKGMKWEEIAQITLGGSGSIPPEEFSRESARLRKRYQKIKDALQRALEASGGPGADRD